MRPKVVIRVRDLAVDALAGAVAAGDVDLTIGPDRAASDSINQQTAFTSLWVLWYAPSHSLAKKRTLKWKDLLGVSLVAAVLLKIDTTTNAAELPDEF
ncbi:LysR substrate-binding domain-containing protein [Duganella guangzhouensis]|uniref:LysR substrate-binding domain-containing protein n=1 Tax=Duganella guangzhouensis TaxID=2666084 RepID=UPI001E5FBE68|nr:LysR substrate-binding domain-containing protein [Duganella guangzhouensis]